MTVLLLYYKDLVISYWPVPLLVKWPLALIYYISKVLAPEISRFFPAFDVSSRSRIKI